MKVVMNDLRKTILKTLGDAPNGLTLNELSEKLGTKVSSGTTNPMVSAGYINAQEIEIEFNKVRKDTGAIIGVGHTKVNIYTLGEVKAEQKKGLEIDLFYYSYVDTPGCVILGVGAAPAACEITQHKIECSGWAPQAARVFLDPQIIRSRRRGVGHDNGPGCIRLT